MFAFFYMSTDFTRLSTGTKTPRCMYKEISIWMVVSILVDIIFRLRYIDYVNNCKPMARRKYWREHNNFFERNVSIKNSKYIPNKMIIYVCKGAGQNYIFINLREIAQIRDDRHLLSSGNTQHVIGRKRYRLIICLSVRQLAPVKRSSRDSLCIHFCSAVLYPLCCVERRRLRGSCRLLKW
jgi:hypothetical protein